MSRFFKVQKQPCSTCIYRQSYPLDIQVLEKEIADPLMKSFFSSYRVCHHTKDVCCRGFWERHKNHFTLGQLAQRFNRVLLVEEDSLHPSSSDEGEE